MAICKDCQIELVFSENWSQGYAKNHTYVCKTCAYTRTKQANAKRPKEVKDYMTQYYVDNKEQEAVRMREWRMNNPGKQREYNLKRNYGLTTEQFDWWKDQQNNRCAVCQQQPPEDKNLVIDHNHVTGQIRGLLCNNCNTGLGLFKDDITRLASAILYLQQSNNKEN